MSKPDVSSHAPLLDRLCGKAFLPGVDYVTQAQAWMLEAAATIEIANDWHDAAIEVDYWATKYMNARSNVDSAQALVSLHNAISDLRSWLPGYDVETGTLPWERENEAS